MKKDRTLLLRDERKMEKLKAKLHTDDDCEFRLAKTSRCCWYHDGFLPVSLTHRRRLDMPCHSLLIHSLDILRIHEITTVIFPQRKTFAF